MNGRSLGFICNGGDPPQIVKNFGYLESKPQYWRPGHSVLVKEIEDVNKMKMGLYVTHTINFQKSGDRSSRRCELALELKKIFEEVGIAYRLLPQEVHLGNVGSPSSAAAGPT
ncbi:hypothetical protein NL676_035903 [Syzygium grande]|nr:hypothetical protein NL676_035903 [Syzygium grande]